jgi:hypothetical protein
LASTRRADCLDDVVRLAQVLVARAVALDQVGDGVEPEAVDAHLEPELHGLQHRVEHGRVVEVEVGLVAEEAVPEILALATSSQVQLDFSVSVKMMRVPVQRAVVAPDVEVALGEPGRAARRLEPGVLVGGVVDDQFGDHAQPAAVRFVDERAESRPACRSSGARPRSRPRRSRRRAAATGRTAAARSC